MLDRIIEFMRCPRCGESRLRLDAGGIVCPACATRCPLRNGILDVLGTDCAAEVITPFQRIMQTPVVVSIYERTWRRLGYFIASSRSFDDEIQSILRLQGEQEGSERVLDLACGTGVFTRPLARHARGMVVGFDLSWPMLIHARRLLAREGPDNVVLMRGTAFRLPFADGTFTSINCCGALHLFDQPDLALREIARVLHGSGRLSVQTTIRPERSGGIAYFLERFIRFGFFNEAELNERLRSHKLKILEHERHRISYTFLACHIS